MTLDHDYIRERLSGFVDSELSPEDQYLVEQHLAECDECATIVARLRRMDDLVAEHSELADDGYWEAQASTIEQKLGFAETEVTDVRPETRKKSSGWMWKTVSVAASIAVLAFVGYHAGDILDDVLETPATQTPSMQAPSEQLQIDDAIQDQATGDGVEGEVTEDVEQGSTSSPDEVGDVQVDQEAAREETHSEARPEVQPEAVSDEVQPKIKSLSSPVPPPVPELHEESTEETAVEQSSVEPVQTAPSVAKRSGARAREQTSTLSLEQEPTTTESAPLGSEDHETLSPNYKVDKLYLDATVADNGPPPPQTTDSMTIWRNAIAEYTSARDKAATSRSRKPSASASQSTRPKLTQGFTTSLMETGKTVAYRQFRVAYACYKIALLSEDKEERNEAMSILDSFLASKEKPIKDSAWVLIKKLRERD